jgi:hypothetical protein
MRKNYNYTRRKLFLPEYGRHIQEMVDSLLLIEDRQERTRQAKAVIAVMGNLNSTLRDSEDFKHKLWDHLFIMSDFKLDVDSPYNKPSREELTLTPRRLSYPQTRIMFKHYGKYAQRFVRLINEQSVSESSTKSMLDIGRYLRVKSYEYNNEHPKNDSIVRDMRLMAGGEIGVDMTELFTMRSEYCKQPQRNHKRKGAVQRNNGRKPQRNAKQHQRTK